MALHVRPGGLLCLVLPLRCVQAGAVGLQWFRRLLEGLQLDEAMPVRTTPKLAFFVCKRRILELISTGTPGKEVNSVNNEASLVSGLPADVRAHFSEDAIRTRNLDTSREFAIILP